MVYLMNLSHIWNKKIINQTKGKLQDVNKSLIDKIVQTIPHQWQVEQKARTALTELIFSRAVYLADNMPDIIENSNGMLF